MLKNNGITIPPRNSTCVRGTVLGKVYAEPVHLPSGSCAETEIKPRSYRGMKLPFKNTGVRLPTVSCSGLFVPNLQVLALPALEYDAMYLTKKLVACIGRIDCSELHERIKGLRKNKLIVLAIPTAVTDDTSVTRFGPTLDAFLSNCQVIPNVVSANSNVLAQGISVTLEHVSPVCNYNSFRSLLDKIEEKSTAFNTDSLFANATCKEFWQRGVRPNPKDCNLYIDPQKEERDPSLGRFSVFF